MEGVTHNIRHCAWKDIKPSLNKCDLALSHWTELSSWGTCLHTQLCHWSLTWSIAWICQNRTERSPGAQPALWSVAILSIRRCKNKRRQALNMSRCLGISWTFSCKSLFVYVSFNIKHFQALRTPSLVFHGKQHSWTMSTDGAWRCTTIPIRVSIALADESCFTNHCFGAHSFFEEKWKSPSPIWKEVNSSFYPSLHGAGGSRRFTETNGHNKNRYCLMDISLFRY